MPQTPHVEKHFTASEVVRDIVIGMSDGLTVPFALAAGLSGAVESSGIIVTAGLAEVAGILPSYGLEDDKVAAVVNSLRADKKRWVDFMIRFELGLEEPDPKRARNSALTIALSYIAGNLVPLAPHFFFRPVHSALVGSVVVTLLALLVFGYVKGRFTTAKPLRSAWQTVVVGGPGGDGGVHDCQDDRVMQSSLNRPC
jgi:VIT1/CCC1 family predicted Fe2+/Mn2+ transporter